MPVALPREWAFQDYNAPNTSKARAFVAGEGRGGDELRVPYRKNRAIVFSSKLLHETAPMCWSARSWRDRRISFTFLFGPGSRGGREPAA